jgi:hypothetical protein
MAHSSWDTLYTTTDACCEPWFSRLGVLREASHLSKEKYFAKKSQPLGRPKNRWEDDIRNYIKKLKIKNWTNCIQESKDWKLYVEKAKTFEELKL